MAAVDEILEPLVEELQPIADRLALELLRRLIRDRVLELVDGGLSTPAIGDVLGVDHSTIARDRGASAPAEPNGTRPAAEPPTDEELACSACHAEPRLPGRTIGRTCKQRRDSEHRSARRRERRASASDTDGGPRAGATDVSADTVEPADAFPHRYIGEGFQGEAPGDGDDEHAT